MTRDLVDDGYLILEPRLDQTLRTPPELFEKNGEFFVEGRTKRLVGRDQGEIGVSVVGLNGELLQDALVRFGTKAPSSTRPLGVKSGSYRLSRARHHSFAVYRVVFWQLPPKGSMVKVSHTVEAAEGVVGKDGK